MGQMTTDVRCRNAKRPTTANGQTPASQPAVGRGEYEVAGVRDRDRARRLCGNARGPLLPLTIECSSAKLGDAGRSGSGLCEIAGCGGGGWRRWNQKARECVVADCRRGGGKQERATGKQSRQKKTRRGRQGKPMQGRAVSRKKERQQQRRDGGCESLFFGFGFESVNNPACHCHIPT